MLTKKGWVLLTVVTISAVIMIFCVAPRLFGAVAAIWGWFTTNQPASARAQGIIWAITGLLLSYRLWKSHPHVRTWGGWLFCLSGLALLGLDYFGGYKPSGLINPLIWGIFFGGLTWSWGKDPQDQKILALLGFITGGMLLVGAFL